MRQIPISVASEQVAHKYLKRLRSERICKKVKEDLEKLISKYENRTVNCEWKIGRGQTFSIESFDPIQLVSYLRHLLKRYDALRTMHPRKFSNAIYQFEKIISSNRINCQIRNAGSSVWNDSLATEIVKSMKYNKVRELVYPIVIRPLGIKTCVYCNANYAISDIDGRGYFDLDHWKPKSIYPYLCTSFYNLQPSCSSCNRRKGNNIEKHFFRLWDDTQKKELKIFRFYLDAGAIVRYWQSRKKDDLALTIGVIDSRNMQILTDSEDSLHLTVKYKEHTDVIEEIIWKRQIYNASFVTSLGKSLPGLLINTSDIKRFIMGTYCDEEDIHKRPLSKMVQDIGKQLGLL